MKKRNSILVVAFKYNDILYGISTEEYLKAEYKKLAILYTSGNRPEDYPLQNLFDEVKYIHYHNTIPKMIINIWNIKINKRFWYSDTIMMCNPILLVSQMIYKYSKAQRVIWLEDGLMNYYPIEDIHFRIPRTIKAIVQNLLFIEDIDKSCDSMSTYLLRPEYAKSYWGEIKPLIPNDMVFSSIEKTKFSYLEGKRIFVGQPLYKEGVMTIDEYSKIVNKIIIEYGVDYYLAHFFSSQQEAINCPIITWRDLGMTMELIACLCSFHIFAFSSTLLYSTKSLNGNVKTTMVDIGYSKQNISILRDTVNEIIVVE